MKKHSASKRLTAVIIKEGALYVAHCEELDIVSQGKTIEEAQANLREAVELFIESFGAEGPDVSSIEIVFTFISDEKRSKKFKQALDRANERHSKMLKRLSH